jgi:hypothetical protein
MAIEISDFGDYKEKFLRENPTPPTTNHILMRNVNTNSLAWAHKDHQQTYEDAGFITEPLASEPKAAGKPKEPKAAGKKPVEVDDFQSLGQSVDVDNYQIKE